MPLIVTELLSQAEEIIVADAEDLLANLDLQNACSQIDSKAF